ncbi:hypothetical protein STEG23_018367, partial [Scotinomys teguina]
QGFTNIKQINVSLCQGCTYQEMDSMDRDKFIGVYNISTTLEQSVTKKDTWNPPLTPTRLCRPKDKSGCKSQNELEERTRKPVRSGLKARERIQPEHLMEKALPGLLDEKGPQVWIRGVIQLYALGIRHGKRARQRPTVRLLI